MSAANTFFQGCGEHPPFDPASMREYLLAWEARAGIEKPTRICKKFWWDFNQNMVMAFPLLEEGVRGR